MISSVLPLTLAFSAFASGVLFIRHRILLAVPYLCMELWNEETRNLSNSLSSLPCSAKWTFCRWTYGSSSLFISRVNTNWEFLLGVTVGTSITTSDDVIGNFAVRNAVWRRLTLLRLLQICCDVFDSNCRRDIAGGCFCSWKICGVGASQTGYPPAVIVVIPVQAALVAYLVLEETTLVALIASAWLHWKDMLSGVCCLSLRKQTYEKN